MFGVEALAGLLAGGLVTGLSWHFLHQILVEAGTMQKSTLKQEPTEERGPYTHAAAVVGDTVGDPFKDTLALHSTF